MLSALPKFKLPMQPHFSKGARDSIAFVFSCPGHKEKIAGHPAAGVTGRNLEQLLPLLASRLGKMGLTRMDVTIANAWKDIEYKNLTGRSEATDAEIRLPGNIKRLTAEIQHVSKLIVFCGDKAKIASKELIANQLHPEQPKFAFLGHLGIVGLNKIFKDVNGNPIIKAKDQKKRGRCEGLRQIQSENTSRRLEVVVAQLVASIV